MRVCWTLAFLSVACSGHGHRAAGTGDAGAGPVVEGSCPHDPERCPGTCNAQGYCEHDFGWGPEIRVPQGTYGVEYRGPEVARAWDEAPALVTFPRSYWIDKRETSAERYRRCSSCAAADASMPGEMPVQVSLAEARAFCEETGRRLPTNAEWEAAARGPSPCHEPAEIQMRQGNMNCNLTAFPWGDDESTLCARTHSSQCQIQNGPRAVGPHPEGASPLGVEELSGNVAEWISDPEGDKGLVKGWDWAPVDKSDDVPRRLAPYLTVGGRAWKLASSRQGVRCVRGPAMDEVYRVAPKYLR